MDSFITTEKKNYLDVYDCRPQSGMCKNIHAMGKRLIQFFNTYYEGKLADFKFVELPTVTQSDGGIINCIIMSKLAFLREDELFCVKNIEKFPILLVRLLLAIVGNCYRYRDKNVLPVYQGFFPCIVFKQKIYLDSVKWNEVDKVLLSYFDEDRDDVEKLKQKQMLEKNELITITDTETRSNSANLKKPRTEKKRKIASS